MRTAHARPWFKRVRHGLYDAGTRAQRRHVRIRTGDDVLFTAVSCVGEQAGRHAHDRRLRLHELQHRDHLLLVVGRFRVAQTTNAWKIRQYAQGRKWELLANDALHRSTFRALVRLVAHCAIFGVDRLIRTVRADGYQKRGAKCLSVTGYCGENETAALMYRIGLHSGYTTR